MRDDRLVSEEGEEEEEDEGEEKEKEEETRTEGLVCITPNLCPEQHILCDILRQNLYYSVICDL